MSTHVSHFERTEVLPRLALLVAELDPRKVASLPWAGAALITGLLENA